MWYDHDCHQYLLVFRVLSLIFQYNLVSKAFYYGPRDKRKPGSNRYRDYTDKMLQRTIDAVVGVLKIQAASIEFNVPRRVGTIGGKLYGEHL